MSSVTKFAQNIGRRVKLKWDGEVRKFRTFQFFETQGYGMYESILFRKSYNLVQFPNYVPVIVNLTVTVNFVTQCNDHFCWQASLLHLRPSFSSTMMITRTIYVQDLTSGTVLINTINDIFRYFLGLQF